jgi:hypothetical protein
LEEKRFELLAKIIVDNFIPPDNISAEDMNDLNSIHGELKDIQNNSSPKGFARIFRKIWLRLRILWHKLKRRKKTKETSKSTTP